MHGGRSPAPSDHRGSPDRARCGGRSGAGHASAEPVHLAALLLEPGARPGSGPGRSLPEPELSDLSDRAGPLADAGRPRARRGRGGAGGGPRPPCRVPPADWRAGFRGGRGGGAAAHRARSLRRGRDRGRARALARARSDPARAVHGWRHGDSRGPQQRRGGGLAGTGRSGRARGAHPARRSPASTSCAPGEVASAGRIHGILLVAHDRHHRNRALIGGLARTPSPPRPSSASATLGSSRRSGPPTFGSWGRFFGRASRSAWRAAFWAPSSRCWGARPSTRARPRRASGSSSSRASWSPSPSGSPSRSGPSPGGKPPSGSSACRRPRRSAAGPER